MKKLFWCLIGVPVLIGLVSPAIAQPGGGQRGGGGGRGGQHGFAFWKMEKVIEKLSLTPDQIQQLEDIEYNFRMEGIDPEARLKKARLELDHLLSQDTFSTEKVELLTEEITAASGERIKIGVKKQIAIRKVLTPEQWTRLERERERVLRRMRGGRKGQRGGPQREGKGRGPGPPPEEEAEEE